MQHRAFLSGLLVSAALLMAPSTAWAQQPGGGLAASGLVGELQGPELVLDPAKWPKSFNESPELAVLVKAGVPIASFCSAT
jgi:hypothetical protein